MAKINGNNNFNHQFQFQKNYVLKLYLTIAFEFRDYY